MKTIILSIPKGIDYGKLFEYDFYSDGIIVKEGFVHIPILYFQLPPSYLNGQAATFSAIALNKAINDTHDWLDSNPDVMDVQLAQEFMSNLQSAMQALGGSVSTNETFLASNPAPYFTSFLVTGNCK